jgi:hypothetical protein
MVPVSKLGDYVVDRIIRDLRKKCNHGEAIVGRSGRDTDLSPTVGVR